MFSNVLIGFNFFFATMVIFCNNVLYAIICLVLTIIGSCILLFKLKIEFLSFLLLLIYIGAVLILFLFIVMMLQLNTNELKKKDFFTFSKFNLIYFMLGLKTFIFLYFLNTKICVFLNQISYEYLQSSNTINVFYNLVLLTGNDSILFLGIFTQKFYVIQATFLVKN